MHREGFHLEDVKNRNVIDSRGDNVGRIVDVVIDPGSWRVSHFLVNLRRDLEPEVTGRQPALFESGGGHLFELAAERVRTVGDNVVLNVGLDTILERLRAAEMHETASTYAGRAEADRLRYGRDLAEPEPLTRPAGTLDDGLPPMP